MQNVGIDPYIFIFIFQLRKFMYIILMDLRKTGRWNYCRANVQYTKGFDLSSSLQTRYFKRRQEGFML